MLVAPKNLRLEKDVITKIYRSLKGPGKINVTLGQQVTPSEIIGSSTVSSGFRTLNLSQLLGISAADVREYLRRRIGQKIYKGELLAFRSAGFFRRQRLVTAPTDGVLDFLNPQTGELRMSLLPQKVDLPAGVYGVVENIDKLRGQIIIRTQVTKIFGVFGTGRPRDGILHILSSKDSLVGVSMILPKFAEHILVGGSLIYKDAISAAISAGINGIITGGINAKDYRGMAGGRLIFPRKIENDVGISIVCCEGFGTVPIGGDIYDTLRQYESRFVLIDGNQSMIILPSFEQISLKRVLNTKLPSDENLGKRDFSEENAEIKIGSKVRVVGATYSGEQGKVVSLNKSKTLLDSGIWDYLLTIETRSRKIQIPVSNVELI